MGPNSNITYNNTSQKKHMNNNTYISLEPITTCFICRRKVRMIMDTQTHINKGKCIHCNQKMWEILDIPGELGNPNLETNKLPSEMPFCQSVPPPNFKQKINIKCKILKLFGPDVQQNTTKLTTKSRQ